MEITLQKSIGFKINKVANNLNSLFNQILLPFDIAIEQRVTLEIISQEKEATLTKISNTLSKDKTTISRTLRTLEKKELIKKVLSNDDKRVSIILTKKGEETLKASQNITHKFRESLVSKLDEKEMDTLFKLLNKVDEGVRDYE
jgi:DNA-binding MarR family transcriptional regulator